MPNPETEKLPLSEAECQGKGVESKQANQLIDIAKGAPLFHSPDNTCHGDTTVKGRPYTWSRSRTRKPS